MGVARDERQVSQVPQCDEVLRVERERRLKNGLGLFNLPRLEERLPVDDMPAHVAGLLWQILPANRYGLLDVAGLAVLVGQRGEVPPRILLELLTQFLYAGGARHERLFVGTRAGGNSVEAKGKIHLSE